MNTRTIPAAIATVALALGLAACGGTAETEPTLADLELEQARWESQERETYCRSFEAVTPGAHEMFHAIDLEGAEAIRMRTKGMTRTEPYSCDEPLFDTLVEEHLEEHHDESPMGQAGIAYGVN